MGFLGASISCKVQRPKTVRKLPEEGSRNMPKRLPTGKLKDIYLFLIGFSNGIPKSRNNNNNKSQILKVHAAGAGDKR